MGTRQFAVVVTKDLERTLVPLTQEPKIFGRIAVYVDVCLRDERVAKELFKIRWNTHHLQHEIQVLGAYYPPSLNGHTLLPDDCHLLSVGDVLEIGSFKMEYIEVSPPDTEASPASFEINRTLANEAQLELEGCEACRDDAKVPFHYVLDRIRGQDPGKTNYVLKIPVKCLNCTAQLIEKTLVKSKKDYYRNFQL